MEVTQERDGLQDVLPTASAIAAARNALFTSLPLHGMGYDLVNKHLTEEIVPALNRSSQSPHYYGFVTGGATPAALSADHIVSQTDQNVQVHLPDQTVATNVEDGALRMICDLLELPHDQWRHRTFTTGATASNVMGLACGREYVIQKAAEIQVRTHPETAIVKVSSGGLFNAMRAAGLEDVQILSTVPHSSLRKAASIVGLGQACFEDVGHGNAAHNFDLHRLEELLGKRNVASIVCVSCAEVNTGYFATDYDDMLALRKLCDTYGAWLHIDAAFGLLARTLPDTDEYAHVKAGVAGLELADSITGDAHKLLNVPYDCGIFLSRHLELGVDVFKNTNAAYLSMSAPGNPAVDVDTIMSPLNVGIENSRRFRALPVYATLAAYGRDGYKDMMRRQIQLSREIASLILASPKYELLPEVASNTTVQETLKTIYIIVLFRAKDETINANLSHRINATRRVYVSPTQWAGKPATRFAVANWQVNVDRDLTVVKEVLEHVAG